MTSLGQLGPVMIPLAAAVPTYQWQFDVALEESAFSFTEADQFRPAALDT